MMVSIVSQVTHGFLHTDETGVLVALSVRRRFKVGERKKDLKVKGKNNEGVKAGNKKKTKTRKIATATTTRFSSSL